MQLAAIQNNRFYMFFLQEYSDAEGTVLHRPLLLSSMIFVDQSLSSERHMPSVALLSIDVCTTVAVEPICIFQCMAQSCTVAFKYYHLKDKVKTVFVWTQCHLCSCFEMDPK